MPLGDGLIAAGRKVSSLCVLLIGLIHEKLHNKKRTLVLGTQVASRNARFLFAVLFFVIIQSQ